MGTRILIVLVVVIVLLAVLAIMLGANRTDRSTEKRQAQEGDPPAYVGLLAGAFAWMAPGGFDLEHVGKVEGAVLDRTKRTLTFTAGQKAILTVVRDPQGDANSCRSLRLVLAQPAVKAPGPALVELSSDSRWSKPRPDDFETPDPGQILPNPEVRKDRWSGRIDPAKYGECSIPVFKGGATIVLMPKHDCTVEIR
jgi:hypothetical protein